MGRAGRPRVGISSCLLGEKVRWDGGDRRHALLLESLGPFVEWVAVCPEAELGLGVPREPIRLVGEIGAPRLVGERTRVDLTEAMARWAERRLEPLVAAGLDGWVTKARSPSCGLRAVPVWADDGGLREAGMGAFVRVLRERLPALPIAEEGELEDADARARFLEACRAHLSA